MPRDATLPVNELDPVAAPDQAEPYPLLVRIYGVLSIIAGGVQVAAVVLILLALLLGNIFGGISLDQLPVTGHGSITTVAIGIVEVIASVTLAAMFVLLGVRLLRGKRRLAAALADAMIVLEAAVLICQFLLTGLTGVLALPAVNMAILVVLQSYSDPALREERALQRKLRQMETRTEAEEGTLGRDTTGRGYISLNFFNLFWVFVLTSVIGLGIETVYHAAVVVPGEYQDRAGLLYGPFSPIYGVGAVLMTVALNRFHNGNPVVIFVVSAVIGGAFEFFASWFFETAFGLKAWDYTGSFLSIDGRTNFMFMCMWGVLGLVWVRFTLPAMLDLVNKIPWNLRYAATSACAALMVVDCMLTLASFDCWYQRQAGTMDYADASAIVAFCNEHYDDAFMANRFQSMTLRPEDASRVA